MNKIIIAFFILLAGIINTVAQGNSISGHVLNNNNEPLIGVNILLKEKNIGAETGFDGSFEIKTSKGKFTLIVSYIGFKTREILVNAPVNLSNIILYEGNELLQEVLLTSRNNKFSRKKTAYVSKLPLKDIENSQVYTTVTSEMLESQVVTNLDEAMANATGVYKLWEATGRGPGNGTSFFSTRGFSVQPRLIDGIAGVTFSAIDPSYIERIEVIKGPAATLFGSTETSLGGLINIVTKKPYQGTGGSISYTAGSFGLHRASVDYNTSLDTSKKAFFRVNASFLTQGSFQDAGFKDTYFIAPSLSLRVNNRLNISAGLEFSKTKQTNPSMLFLRRGLPLISKNIKEMGVDPKKSFTNNDINLTNPTFNTRAIADYKLSDTWTSQTVFSSSYAQTKGYYQYQFDGGVAALLQINQVYNQLENAKKNGLITAPQLAFINANINPFTTQITTEAGKMLATDSFVRTYSKRDANETRFNLQQNFTGNFNIGQLRNRLVFGVDYLSNNRNNRNKNGNPNLTKQSQFPQLIGTLNALGLNAVSDGITASFFRFPYIDAFLNGNGTIANNSFTPTANYSPDKAQLDADFKKIPAFKNQTKQQTLAAYVSDVINITPELIVNVGLRLDHFIQDGQLSRKEDDYTKTTLSPNFGVSYQALKNKLSVFTNYQTGFVNVNPVVNASGTVDVFQPQKAKQFEGGIKTNFFNNKLNIGASYYNITVKDFTTSDPTIPLFPKTIDIAEVVSKGFEFELNANPINGLNLRGSYSFNDMKYTNVYSKKAKREITEFKNRRPEAAGPKGLYNFWADYAFQEDSFAKNFGLGFGFNGASENLTVNNKTSGTFTLPSYTILNVSAYYNLKKIRVGFKVNNLTNKTYYTGWTTINAQPSRAFLGSVSYNF
ncbi:TonB-dependent receptor [Tenacibaculum dicentrarchi]|nr:TonB-dependent receptor [Tenacibaculum dicentrarchi]MCG8836854.1 TonB-dependent receptor [Tenacibaculum dicentrarchi]